MKKLPLVALLASIGFGSNLWAAKTGINEEVVLAMDVYAMEVGGSEVLGVISKPRRPNPPSILEEETTAIVSKPRNPKQPGTISEVRA